MYDKYHAHSLLLVMLYALRLMLPAWHVASSSLWVTGSVEGGWHRDLFYMAFSCVLSGSWAGGQDGGK